MQRKPQFKVFSQELQTLLEIKGFTADGQIHQIYLQVTRQLLLNRPTVAPKQDIFLTLHFYAARRKIRASRKNRAIATLQI